MGKLSGVAIQQWKKSLMICLAVSIENRRVTDRRIDKRTDRQTNILPQHSALCTASRGKNWSIFGLAFGLSIGFDVPVLLTS